MNAIFTLHYIEITSLLLQVWEQCGFEPEHKFDMNAFRKAVTENGTILHPFLVALASSYVSTFNYFQLSSQV